MTDLNELKRLAREATPGPWRWWTSCSFRRLSSDVTGADGDVLHAVTHVDGVADVVGTEQNRAFIAAANPAAVLALIERVEIAEADNAALLALLHKVADCGFKMTGAVAADVDELLRRNHPGAALLEELEGLRRRVETQRASIAGLQDALDTARNAALEEVATARDARRRHGEAELTSAEIRAMKSGRHPAGGGRE